MSLHQQLVGAGSSCARGRSSTWPPLPGVLPPPPSDTLVVASTAGSSAAADSTSGCWQYGASSVPLLPASSSSSSSSSDLLIPPAVKLEGEQMTGGEEACSRLAVDADAGRPLLISSVEDGRHMADSTASVMVAGGTPVSCHQLLLDCVKNGPAMTTAGLQHHQQQQQLVPTVVAVGETESCIADAAPTPTASKQKNSNRRNAWGPHSYADLITQAIMSSPEKRLTLAQVYDWMVTNIPWFKDKGDSTSSAGWKNSIRHNLSLHSRFIKVQNEGTGKSSWWMINPDAAKAGKCTRRRATIDSATSNKFEKKRGRSKKKADPLRGAMDAASIGGAAGVGVTSSVPPPLLPELDGRFPESPLHPAHPAFLGSTTAAVGAELRRTSSLSLTGLATGSAAHDWHFRRLESYPPTDAMDISNCPPASVLPPAFRTLNDYSMYPVQSPTTSAYHSNGHHHASHSGHVTTAAGVSAEAVSMAADSTDRPFNGYPQSGALSPATNSVCSISPGRSSLDSTVPPQSSNHFPPVPPLSLHHHIHHHALSDQHRMFSAAASVVTSGSNNSGSGGCAVVSGGFVNSPSSSSFSPSPSSSLLVGSPVSVGAGPGGGASVGSVLPMPPVGLNESHPVVFLPHTTPQSSTEVFSVDSHSLVPSSVSSRPLPNSSGVTSDLVSTQTPSQLMSNLMGALQPTNMPGDLDLETFQGGFECDVDNIIKQELSMDDGGLDFSFNQAAAAQAAAAAAAAAAVAQRHMSSVENRHSLSTMYMQPSTVNVAAPRHWQHVNTSLVD